MLSEVQPVHASNCAGRAPRIYGILEVRCCAIHVQSMVVRLVQVGNPECREGLCGVEVQGVGQQAKTRQHTGRSKTWYLTQTVEHRPLGKCDTQS